MKVGLIARSDRTGLGNQTRNLARLLNPDKVLLIDSSSFNGNQQHPETYADYDTTTINGFPTEWDVMSFLREVDVVITCEIFYHNRFVDIARQMGVKTINQYNWEFADYLRNPLLTLPDRLVAPSHWKVQEAINLWGPNRVYYLPTPVFTDDFSKVRERNLKRKGKKRFLHIAGRAAINDRNGTMDLIQAMRYSGADFELVIKSQTGNIEAALLDPRITLDAGSPENEVDLYDGFDAMILPRRYAGQCLPMMEALCAGLPVIMTNIEPNNKALPPQWLVNSSFVGRFMTRTMIDLYAVIAEDLGTRLDFLAGKPMDVDKKMAYNIGYGEYSDKILKEKWEKLIEDTCSR